MQLRLQSAEELCRGMIQAQSPPVPGPMDEPLRMLLIEYWHGKGPEWAAWKFGQPSPKPPASWN